MKVFPERNEPVIVLLEKSDGAWGEKIGAVAGMRLRVSGIATPVLFCMRGSARTLAPSIWKRRRRFNCVVPVPAMVLSDPDGRPLMMNVRIPFGTPHDFVTFLFEVERIVDLTVGVTSVM